MSENFDWSQIEGIRYSFKKHGLRQYSDCHSILNQLSSEIDLPPSLFDEDGTLSTDFTTAIKTAVVNDILQILVDAPSKHVSSLFDNSYMMYKAGNQDPLPLRLLRSSRAFIKAAQGAIDDEATHIEIFFNIDHWHFDRKKWTSMHFEHVSMQEPQAKRPRNAIARGNPTRNQDFCTRPSRASLLQFPPSSLVNPGVYPTTTETSLLNPHRSEGSLANRKINKHCLNQQALDITMSVQFDWTQIKGIRTNFKPHAKAKYARCYKFLQDKLSLDIDMPMIDIFQEEEITSESATLAPDFVKRLRDAFVNEIIQLPCPSSYNNDIVHISRLFSDSTVQYKDNRNRLAFLRTPSSFVKAAQQAINDVDSENYIDLFFTINHWYFDDGWDPIQFNRVSLQEPQAKRPKNATARGNPTMNTNQDQAAVMAAIVNRMERVQQILNAYQLATGIGLSNSFPPSSFVNPGVYPATTETSLLNPHRSEGSIANRRNPERRVHQGVPNPERRLNQGVQISIRTTNTGNTKSYNLANLPAPVRERYEKKSNDKLLGEKTMEPVILPTPTLTASDVITPSFVIPSSFVNPGVYLTTTETSLLNPLHSEGSLANKLTPSRVATSSLATSSIAFHNEPFADLLHQRIQDNNQSKSSTKDKHSLATFPAFCGAQSHLVRKWCQEVLNHCIRLRISLHPYYLSLKETDMENHIFDRDNPANNDVTVPVYSPLYKGPQDPIQNVKPLQRTDEDSPFPIDPAKLPTGICLYNSFPPSSFVNPGVYPTTTGTSLLNPHHSEGLLAHKFSPYHSEGLLANKFTPSRVATSSFALHVELLADLLHQGIQVPTVNKAAKPKLIDAYVLSASHDQVFSLASSTMPSENALIRGCTTFLSHEHLERDYRNPNYKRKLQKETDEFDQTPTSAIKTKSAQITCKAIAFVSAFRNLLVLGSNNELL